MTAARPLADVAGYFHLVRGCAASLIAVAIITAVTLTGTQVSTVFTEVGNALK
jgi:hypothetical protein